MPQWKKKTIQMKPGHRWKAESGFNIFVMDRGAVRFQVPRTWIVEPDDHSIRFFDAPSPNDNCRLECSYLRIPEIDWSELPVTELLDVALKGDSRDLIKCGKPVRSDRQDLEIAWSEFAFHDPNEHRAARTRVGIARGRGIQCLLTMDFWSEDAARFDPVWQHVIRTVELGKYVIDPAKGD